MRRGEQVGSSGALSKQPCSSFERDGRVETSPLQVSDLQSEQASSHGSRTPKSPPFAAGPMVGAAGRGVGKQARGARESRWWAKTGERGQKLRGPGRGLRSDGVGQKRRLGVISIYRLLGTVESLRARLGGLGTQGWETKVSQYSQRETSVYVALSEDEHAQVDGMGRAGGAFGVADHVGPGWR